MNNKKESIKKTTSFAYLFGLSSQGIELLFFFLMFQYFPVKEIGLFSWAMATAAFFAVSMDFGQNMVLVRSFSQGNVSMRYAFRCTAVFRLPLLVVGLLLINLWYLIYTPALDRYWVVLVACLIQLLMIVEVFFKSWLSANSRQNISNALDFCISAGRISVILILIFMMQRASALYLFGALFAMHLAIVAVTFYVAYREYNKVRMAGTVEDQITGIETKKMMAPSLIFGFIALFTVIQNRLDWLMISHYISEIELARYSLANKFYEVFMIIFGISIKTAYPWMCRVGKATDDDGRLSLFINIVVAAGTLAPLLIAFYAPYILLLLWGDKYQSAGVVVQLLMVAASIATFAGVGYYMTTSKNRESRIIPILVAATVVQVAVNFFLIPRYGSMGAAVGMLSMTILSAVGYLWFLLVGGIKSSSQIKRWVTFEMLVLLAFSVLMAFGSNPVMSSLTFLTVALLAMYFTLIPKNERSLLLTSLGISTYGHKVG